MKKTKKIYSREEIAKFQTAVKAGGLRSDARRDAITLLEDYEEGVIVDKYNSMSKKSQQEFRQLHRKMKKGKQILKILQNLFVMNKMGDNIS